MSETPRSNIIEPPNHSLHILIQHILTEQREIKKLLIDLSTDTNIIKKTLHDQHMLLSELRNAAFDEQSIIDDIQQQLT